MTHVETANWVEWMYDTWLPPTPESIMNSVDCQMYCEVLFSFKSFCLFCCQLLLPVVLPWCLTLFSSRRTQREAWKELKSWLNLILPGGWISSCHVRGFLKAQRMKVNACLRVISKKAGLNGFFFQLWRVYFFNLFNLSIRVQWHVKQYSHLKMSGNTDLSFALSILWPGQENEGNIICSAAGNISKLRL